MKLSFHTVIHGGSIKILSKDQNPTTLQSVCEREKRRGVCERETVHTLSKETAQKG